MAKTEIIFPTIERWHCIDMVLKNIEAANKPENCQILCVVNASDEYITYVKAKLINIFGESKVRIVRNTDVTIEHSDLRKDKFASSIAKTEAVYRTYQLARDNVDETVDYYWIIEDDTLFPLDIYDKYFALLFGLKADIITGVSYYWHFQMYSKRNFWDISTTSVFGDKDSSKESTFTLKHMNTMEDGVSKLGATGLGNVLIKKHAFLSWNPAEYFHVTAGADISFFYNAQKKNHKAFGVWDIYLPHITKYENGDIEILGRIDSSIIPLLGGNHDS